MLRHCVALGCQPNGKLMEGPDETTQLNFLSHGSEAVSVFFTPTSPGDVNLNDETLSFTNSDLHLIF